VLLRPTLQDQIRKVFAGMTAPVRFVVFTTDADRHACEICDDTRQLVEELACLADGRISTEIHDLGKDAATAAAYGIDKAPAVLVLGQDGQDPGIRFYGIPSGYELASLVDAAMVVGSGEHGLARRTVAALARLSEPLRIRVFVTPTCPYCPPAVMLAHRMAAASDRVTAEMIDAAEFPDLADHYHVHAVPRIVVNDSVHIEGAVPEATLVERLAPWTSVADTGNAAAAG
jgi:glutaredoxin-like protein